MPRSFVEKTEYMIFIAHLETPIGWLRIEGSELGIRRVNRVEKSGGPNPVLPENHPVSICFQQLSDYFGGKRQLFDLPFDWSGEADFNQKVWLELLKIPFGKTASYSDIAEKIGSPKAVRAVGLANRNNPIAIIVPCHRVIGKSGHLHGYFYGLDVKLQLLRHENPVKFAEQGALFS